jgi:ubiquinone/menaquinone biosynthesis C-methylase UbiE
MSDLLLEREKRIARRDPLWRDWGGAFSSEAAFRAWWIHFLEMADIRPGVRVLDLAGETAGMVVHLLRMVEPGGKVVCLSFTEQQMERMRAEARSFGLAVESKIEWRVATSRRLPFEDGQFDVICCTGGVRHLHVPHVADEAYRVLAVGGRLVLTERLLPGTPRDRFFLSARRAFYRYVRRNPEEAEAILYTADQLAELLRAAGFAQIFLRGLERPRLGWFPVLSLVRAWKGGGQ